MPSRKPTNSCVCITATALWVGTFSAWQVAAAEYMHCYLQDAPADALVSSEYNVSGLLDALPVASLKHACGHEVGPDKALLESIVAAGKCSSDSEIARYVAETFEFSSEELAADMTAQSSPEVFASVCEAVTICAPGESGYDDDCNAALDTAMGG